MARRRGHSRARVVADRDRWRVRFRWEGKPFSKVFRLERQAKQAAEKITEDLNLIRRGILAPPSGQAVPAYVWERAGVEEPKPRRDPMPTRIDHVTERFLEQREPRVAESTRQTDEIHLRHLKNYLSEVGLAKADVSRITRGVVKDYRTWRQKEVEAVTVNKEVATFHTLFAFAVENGSLPANPLAGLESLLTERRAEFHTLDEIEDLIRTGMFDSEGEKRLRKARILYPQEIEELVQLARGRTVHAPLVVAAYTGARRGEIARLTWADVDFNKHQLTLWSRKQSREETFTPRKIEIAKPLFSVLQTHKLKTGGCGYLFAGRLANTHISPHTLSTNLGRVVKGTDFEGIGWHTLRHTLASNMARANIDPREINEIMGHVSESMARRYRHLFPEQRKGVIDRAFGGLRATEACSSPPA